PRRRGGPRRPRCDRRRAVSRPPPGPCPTPTPSPHTRPPAQPPDRRAGRSGTRGAILSYRDQIVLRFSQPCPLSGTPPSVARDELLSLGLHTLRDHVPGIRVAAQHRLGGGLH